MITILVWIRWFLGPLLAYAAIAKILRYEQFRGQVASLGTIAETLSWPITLGVLAGELFLGVLLMSGIGPALTFAGTVGLLLIFTGFVGWVLSTGRKMACYCFGGGDESVSRVTVVRNLVLLAAALTGGLVALITPSPQGGAALSHGETIIVVLYGLSSGSLFLAGQQLATLWEVSRKFV